MLVAATVHEADIQDRDGAVALLASIRHAFPWLRHLFADGGYAGAKLETALAALGTWTLEIVKRSDAAKGFDPLSPLPAPTGSCGTPSSFAGPRIPWRCGTARG